MASSARRLIGLTLYGVLAAFLLVGFLGRYPLPDITAKLIATAGFLFVFGGAVGAGLFLLKRFVKLETDPGWLFIFSAAVGFGVLSFLTLFLGWLPVGSLPGRLTALKILWAGPFLYGAFQLRTSRGMTNWAALPLLSAVCFSLGLLAAGLCFLSAFSPITYYDSLVYHLALPSYYLLEGRIAPAVFNLYSFFPANIEMLYLFVLGGLPEPEQVINLITLGFSALTGLAIYRWAAQEWDAKTGWISVALWATMPAVLLLSVGGYIEIPLALYSLLALRAFQNFLRSEHDHRWLLLSGLLGGFAFATKYTGAITPGLLGLGLVWMAATKKASLKQVALFALAALAPIFPWLLRNAVSIGNPFFPFFYRHFGDRIGWTAESAGAYFQMLTEYGAKSSLFFELLLSPFQMVLNAQKFGGGFDVVGDFGWPLIILALPVGIVVFWKSQKNRWLVIYLLLHFVVWFFTKPVLRFLVGLLPLAALISAVAFRKLLSDQNKVVRSATVFFAGVFILSNLFLYSFVCDVFKPFQVPLGLADRESYLTKRLSFYSSYAYLNSNLNKNHRVFLIGEQRTYHLHIPYMSASIFAPTPIARHCDEKDPQTALNQVFRQYGITHVLLHVGEIERLGGLGKFGFSEAGEDVFRGFLNENGRLIFDQNRVLVYEIGPFKTN